MLEAASAYPAALTRSLVAGPHDAEVTVSLVTGPDRETTEQTLNSFLHCCTDLSRVGRFVVVDTGLSGQDRGALQERYGFLEFSDRGPADDFGAQLAHIRAQIGGRFWLHLGQCWQFFAPENYITRLSAVLDAEPQVFQVGINYGDAVKLTHTCAAGEVVRRTPDTGRYVLTDKVANGPAMFDTARLDQAGGIDGTDPDPVAELARRASAAGLQTASLDEVLCQDPSVTATTVTQVISPPGSSPPKIHRFCIAHTQPLIPESWYDDCIALGSYQPDSVSHVSQLDQFWHGARPIAYGAAGSYVLPIAIEKFASGADLIEISSQRKRILLSPEGKPGPYPRTRELNAEECREKTELSSVITPPNDSGFLLPQPYYHEEGIFGRYARIHFFRDLLDYTSIAVEMGVLDNKSAEEFFTEKVFIPGGTEFGIFPKSWLVPALSQLEQISREFLSNYGHRIKGYDTWHVRDVAALSEHLGGFLLVRHLKERYSNNIPADIFGYMTCVVEKGQRYCAAQGD
jgi:hypothetical protein